MGAPYVQKSIVQMCKIIDLVLMDLNLVLKEGGESRLKGNYKSVGWGGGLRRK